MLQRSSAPLFAMQLNYNDGTTPQYNGNIANQYWGTPGSLNKSYTYTYDNLNRLTAGISNEGYNEQGIAYDVMGNITNLTRQTNAYAYNYSGNQLQSVSGLTSGTYSYDPNGNVNYDARIGSNVTYNYLNLPKTVTSKSLTYTYDAEGKKLRKSNGTINTDYINGIQYDNGTISFVQTEEGRAINSGNNYTYEYNLADQLSNTRLSFNESGVTKQQDDYYPFGLEINRSTTSPKNEYLYNKKELQEELTQYDYGARFYDPVIARWTSVDPLAELGRRWSPYNYGENNPIKNVDPDGMQVILGGGVGGGDYYDGDDAVAKFKELQQQGKDIKKKDEDQKKLDKNIQNIRGGPMGANMTATERQAFNKENGWGAAGFVAGEVGGYFLRPVIKSLSSWLGGLLGMTTDAASVEFTTVGRWMSASEYETLSKTGQMVEGAGGQTFVATGGPDAFKAASKGSVYAEFQIPTQSLLKGGKEGWFKVIGPSANKAMQAALQKQGGELLPEVKNLSKVLRVK